MAQMPGRTSVLVGQREEHLKSVVAVSMAPQLTGTVDEKSFKLIDNCKFWKVSEQFRVFSKILFINKHNFQNNHRKK